MHRIAALFVCSAIQRRARTGHCLGGAVVDGVPTQRQPTPEHSHPSPSPISRHRRFAPVPTILLSIFHSAGDVPRWGRVCTRQWYHTRAGFDHTGDFELIHEEPTKASRPVTRERVRKTTE